LQSPHLAARKFQKNHLISIGFQFVIVFYILERIQRRRLSAKKREEDYGAEIAKMIQG